MATVRAIAATGLLGTGFKEESLRRALQMEAEFVGCDAGSTDPGPYYLGSGNSITSDEAIRRDLTLILRHAVPAGVPVLIGSAGGSGADIQVDRTLQMVRDIAGRERLNFRLAVIHAEQSPGDLADAYAAGQISPLPNAPDLTPNDLRGASRIVAQMGAEPFIAALEQGADVVIAGRASDAAIFAAVPMMRGSGEGQAWHAAKILECGAAAVAQRLYPDCLMADIGGDDFIIFPPNPELACTPQSIAAHTLYENADPFLITEPSGQLDTRQCRYAAIDDRSVRVTGSLYRPRDQYDVRLEGVAFRGHRYVIIGGVRDPLVIRQLDDFLAASLGVVRQKVNDSLAVDETQYQIVSRVYGRDGCMGPLEPERAHTGHEVGLNVEVISASKELAHAVARITWHTMLHQPIPGWSGLVSNIAFPYSPPVMYAGPVYEFMINHVLQLDDPLGPFPISMKDI